MFLLGCRIYRFLFFNTSYYFTHFKVRGKVIIATFLCYGSYGHKFYFRQFMNKEEEDIKEIPKLGSNRIIKISRTTFCLMKILKRFKKENII